MVVLITAVDAAISPGSVAFAKMLKSSLEYRRIESMSLFALQSPVIVDYGSREAANSVFSQDMANESVTYHIDIRSIDTEELGSPIASLDFIIAYAEYATDRNLNESVVETLSGFAEVKEKPRSFLSSCKDDTPKSASTAMIGVSVNVGNTLAKVPLYSLLRLA